MKILNGKLAAFTLTLALSAFSTLLTAGESEQKAARELLDASHFEKTMNETVDASINLVIQADPQLANHEKTLRQFFAKYMNLDTMRKNLIEIYSEVFTVQELNDITAFYKSPTGQKALQKLPEVTQRSLQMGQRQVMQHIAELQVMLQNDMLQKEDQGMSEEEEEEQQDD